MDGSHIGSDLAVHTIKKKCSTRTKQQATNNAWCCTSKGMTLLLCIAPEKTFQPLTRQSRPITPESEWRHGCPGAHAQEQPTGEWLQADRNPGSYNSRRIAHCIKTGNSSWLCLSQEKSVHPVSLNTEIIEMRCRKEMIHRLKVRRS